MILPHRFRCHAGLLHSNEQDLKGLLQGGLEVGACEEIALPIIDEGVSGARIAPILEFNEDLYLFSVETDPSSPATSMRKIEVAGIQFIVCLNLSDFNNISPIGSSPTPQKRFEITLDLPGRSGNGRRCLFPANLFLTFLSS